MTVVFSEFIDSRSVHTSGRGNAPSVAEPDTHMPTMEDNVDVPVAEVAEVNDAVELAPSIVCYCGLPVARYKIRKRSSRWYGEWFIRCPRNHRTDVQCSFFRLCWHDYHADGG